MKASHIRQLAGVDAIKSALTERHKREQGSILFVALILLIILTLLAFTALRTATMQERMAGNARDRAIAFQAAEAALRGAEKYLASNPSPAAATFSGTTCSAKGVYKLVNGVPYFASTGSSFSGTSTKWDGSSQDFWNQYPWETNNCSFSGTSDNITFVSSSDYGKPGKPTKSSRFVIEEMPADGNGLASYRVTAKGWGSSDNAVVIIQATYTSQ